MSTVRGQDGNYYDAITGALVTTPNSMLSGLSASSVTTAGQSPSVSLSTPTNGLYNAMQLEKAGVTDNANANIYTDYTFDPSKTGTDDFWTMKGGGGLALGGLQTGIGLMGTLDAMKTAKLQRKLLGQQYETNNEKMSHWRDSNAGVVSAFTGGGGLAASGVKP